ncbi:hypothetical protein Dimus_015434 [Dionaea muscipula]
MTHETPKGHSKPGELHVSTTTRSLNPKSPLPPKVPASHKMIALQISTPSPKKPTSPFSPPTIISLLLNIPLTLINLTNPPTPKPQVVNPPMYPAYHYRKPAENGITLPPILNPQNIPPI